MKYSFPLFIIGFFLLGSWSAFGQQDPQYTQYMYNTQVINPAYAGNRGNLSFGLLYRTQWVGVEGAPKTLTFSVNSPIGMQEKMGLGLSVVRDEIGPSTNTNFTIDYSYSIYLNYNARLSFGIKAGADVLNVNFDELNIYNPSDPLFQNNIDNRWQPQVGAGIYFNTRKFYVGLSVPNFLETEHYKRSDGVSYAEASDRMHYFLMAGYVWDVSPNLKIKPATLVKAVRGAPLQVDISANFLIHKRFTLGASYRFDAAVSALAGFQVSPSIFIGVAYDHDLSEFQHYNDGSYEAFLRFDIFNREERVLTPRFF